jgi:hypothetical protein
MIDNLLIGSSVQPRHLGVILSRDLFFGIHYFRSPLFFDDELFLRYVNRILLLIWFFLNLNRSWTLGILSVPVLVHIIQQLLSLLEGHIPFPSFNGFDIPRISLLVNLDSNFWLRVLIAGFDYTWNDGIEQ